MRSRGRKNESRRSSVRGEAFHVEHAARPSPPRAARNRGRASPVAGLQAGRTPEPGAPIRAVHAGQAAADTAARPRLAIGRSPAVRTPALEPPAREELTGVL